MAAGAGNVLEFPRRQWEEPGLVSGEAKERAVARATAKFGFQIHFAGQVIVNLLVFRQPGHDTGLIRMHWPLIAMAIPATRRQLVRHVLPKSGEGPPAELREAGSCELTLVGEFPDRTILKARETGAGDPGVESPARMLTEAALCPAEDEGKIDIGRFWTPASAFGARLRDRVIAHAGLSFELVSAA